MKTIKYLIIILAILLSNSTKIYSQGSTDTLTKSRFPIIFEEDNTLKLLARFIPEIWEMVYSGDTLKFISSSDIFKVDQNIINDTVKISRKHRKTHEKQINEKAEIFFKIETVWSPEKTNESFLHNNFINSRIANLKNRVGVSELEEKINLNDYETDLSLLDDRNQKIILRYFEEKRKLESELIQIPDYNTTNYSLFIIKIYPNKEIEHLYSPPGVINELKELIALFEKYVGK